MIKSVGMKQLERSYPDISEGVAQAISEVFPESVKVWIDTEDSFKNLLQEIKNAPKPFVGKLY